MRTTIIPAQVTTVEDRITGSLTMTQILILLVPVLWTAIVHIAFLPAGKLVPYKIGLVLAIVPLCLILALRMKDKLVVEWLRILMTYRLRPKYYCFNKNDLTNRTVDIPDMPMEKIFSKKAAKTVAPAQGAEVSIIDRMKLEHFIRSGNVIRYQWIKKAI